MKRITTLLALVACFALQSMAQLTQKEIALADNQYWWGYYQDEELGICGGPSNCDFDAAIFISPEQTDVVGKTMKGIRFYMFEKKFLKDTKVWLATKLPVVGYLADLKVVDVTDEMMVDEGFAEVPFDEGFVVPETGLYVGYSFNTEGVGAEDWMGMFPIACAFDVTSAGSHFGKMNGSAWSDRASSYGGLTIQVLLEGDVAKNSVEPQAFNDAVVAMGETTQLSLGLKNKGTAGISSIDYFVTIDGNDGEQQHFDLEANYNVFDGIVTIPVTLTAATETKRQNIEVTVTKVNGETNEAAAEVARCEGGLITIQESLPRRTVVEECTGTWCGWCPRGTTGLEMLTEQMPDKAIGIAVHGNDIMAINEYSFVRSMIQGYPSAVINRSFTCDPYFGKSLTGFGLVDIVNEQTAILTEAKIEIEAQWDETNDNIINTKTSTIFGFNSDKDNYGIGYVLVADGLEGPGKNWLQENYYSGDEDYRTFEGLEEWVDADEQLAMPFNHVAIAAYDIEEGTAESIALPLVAGETQSFSFAIDTENNSLVQDKEKLKVVAMLINKQTGLIVNAAQTAVGTSSLGINEQANDNNHQVGIYTIGGTKTDKMQRGINIVRLADGTVKKVLKR